LLMSCLVYRVAVLWDDNEYYEVTITHARTKQERSALSSRIWCMMEMKSGSIFDTTS
jgi:hypothetical protein